VICKSWDIIEYLLLPSGWTSILMYLKKLFFSLILLSISLTAYSQVRIGIVSGTVVDPVSALIPGASVVLENPFGFQSVTQTDSKGSFVFNNVPFGKYSLRVGATGFDEVVRDITLRSNIPLTLSLQLELSVKSSDVTVADNLIEEDSLSTETRIDQRAIEQIPSVLHNQSLQRLVATVPGVTTQNNGLLHVRGVEDGILYVIDGVPTADRIDAISASGFNIETIRSMSVITGNLPAEFGGRSGAVVVIEPKSGINRPFTGSASFSAGNLATKRIGLGLGGSKENFGYFVSASAFDSHRYLDPVDPRNFNNRGGQGNFSARTDWHLTPRDIVLGSFAVNGADFRVPNDFEQELAGQRQRQSLRDNNQSISWQRVWSAYTVSNLSLFRRYYESSLTPSQFDTPIIAAADRSHTRSGLIVGLTHARGDHTFKMGIEAGRISLREFFRFSIVDDEEAEEREISEPALRFDEENPFIFRGRRVAGTASAYLQDTFRFSNLTVNAGVRYDYSSLPESARQLSPRLGAVYYIPSTKTALRASFNRLFMPPQAENILLSSSQQAYALSPFASTEGGSIVRPERVSAYEVGLGQDLFSFARFDAAFWYRRFKNFDDPNTFFNTTVVFPNSVAEGFSRGVDVRLEVPFRRGFSGFASYTNSRILQTGPINGGLFLTDEVIEIGPGTRFIPDQDQRNVLAFGVTHRNSWTGLWGTFMGRHESGVPLEVEDERLEDLRQAPGSELVDFSRQRVRPWTVFDLAIGREIIRTDSVGVMVQFSVQNLTNRPFAYNFGNPFEGTHFGHPRRWEGELKVSF
jgi:hypothetical protein